MARPWRTQYEDAYFGFVYIPLPKAWWFSVVGITKKTNTFVTFAPCGSTNIPQIPHLSKA
jgi:hypothetical protein